MAAQISQPPTAISQDNQPVEGCLLFSIPMRSSVLRSVINEIFIFAEAVKLLGENTAQGKKTINQRFLKYPAPVQPGRYVQ